MIRWLSIADRGAMALAGVLCVAAATPLLAQQDSVPAPHAGVSAAPASSASSASSASTSLPGPRLRPEWRRAEPSFAGSGTAAPLAAAAGSHTVTVTTLVLVLVVIIAVLLIVR
jgi:hypothetical protein